MNTLSISIINFHINTPHDFLKESIKENNVIYPEISSSLAKKNSVPC